jgi:murein DD-endopeptidase MepM/ murein hydrolase activator NlpD
MRTFLLAAAVWLVLLTACQPQSAPTAALMPPFTPTSTAAAAPTLTPMPTLAAPVVSYSLPEPVHNQPSFKPLDTPEGTVTPLPAVELPTPTPGPTFTPPPPPPPTTDHFWFYRPVAEGGIVWTNKIYPYGSTRGGTLRPHHGVEFDVTYNTEILAANEGTVVFAGPDNETFIGPETNFYGNVVVIQHTFQLDGQNVYSLYGHLSQIYVTVGQAVRARDIIALSGATGVADGPHLHFEVRVGQNSYTHTRNPIFWLLPFPERGVVAGRVLFPNGELAHEAPITLRRIDAPSNYAATTSYALESLNPDDHWQENFAFDDVYAGYYEVVVTQGSKKYKTEVWVYPNQTSFIEIVIFPEIEIVEEIDEP